MREAADRGAVPATERLTERLTELQLVEVRVLGPFRLRTEDGALVDARAWRTAKTRDLVRLLAVAGTLVPADRIVDVLWPDADPQRGRASLRTAASQVRHVLGEDHLVRRGGGLELTGVWVDAAVFVASAESALHRLAAGDHAAGIATAWEAVTLCSGDLCEDDPYTEWIDVERRRHRLLLRQLLLDAAEAAVELGWLRDAVELGSRALHVDPCAERAYRTLMRAYSRLGETEQALGMFEQCRRVLAEQLGADPGESTRALHLELLRPVPPTVPVTPFVGRSRWMEQVRAAMAVVLEEGTPLGLVLTGPPGIGRSRFVQEAVQHWPYRLVQVACRQPSGSGSGPPAPGLVVSQEGAPPETQPPPALRALLGAGPVLLVLEDLQWADEVSLAVVAQLLRERVRPLLVLGTAQPDVGADHPLMRTGRCERLALPPLSWEEVAALLQALLHGAPSRGLVEELADASAGAPGPVIAAARRLMSAGELVSAADGLRRVPRAAGTRPPDLELRLARAREQVGPVTGAVLDVLAVLDRPTPLDELARLCGPDPAGLATTLDRLCDLGVLVQAPQGYCFADPLVRETAYRWLRPTVRRDLHRRVAETAALPATARADHWLRSGEPVLACAAALEAADEAMARGDDVRGRASLLAVASFAAEHGVELQDRVALNERLAQAAARLGRRWEAERLLEEAIALARRGAPEALARLHRELGRLARTSTEALRVYRSAAGLPGVSLPEQRRTALSVAAATAGGSPAAAVALLQSSIVEADGATDVEAQVEARVLLTRAAGQRRDFALAERTANEAMVIAETAGTSVMFVRAAHCLVQTAVYLGDARRRLPLAGRARELSLAAGDPAQIADVGLTYCLALHDLGDRLFASTWSRVSQLTDGGPHSRLRHLLDAHISLERGQLVRAARLLDQLPHLDLVVADDAVCIMRARLLAAGGDRDSAVAALEDLVRQRGAEPTMLAPEALARLAALVAPADPGRGRRHLEQGVRLAAGRLYPRERVCLLQARAVVLAAEDEPEGAATVALAAALTARRAGLVFHEAGSFELRADLLVAAGAASRAAADRRRAAGLCLAAGAPLRARSGTDAPVAVTRRAPSVP